MANNFGSGRIISLDTFTSAIDVNSSMGYKAGTMLKINSIEWQEPSTIDHTVLVTDDLGDDVFNETCKTAGLSITKYFHGAWIQNLKIAISGVGSGAIVIVLE